MRGFQSVAAFLLAAGAAWGGLPAVLTERGSIEIDRTFDSALIIAQDGWQHLVLQPGYAARDTGVAGVPRLGWVIALPEAPAGDSVISDSAIVETWNTLAGMSAHPQPRFPGDSLALVSREETRDVRIVPTPLTGQYEVNILPAREGVGALNRWLAENRFGPLPASAESSYAAAGWTFVAVLIRPETGSRMLPSHGFLRPLRLSFRSDRIVYPVRLTAEDGSCHSFLFVASSAPINLADAEAYGFLPTEAAAVRRRLDFLLWQASAPESSRAVLWYGSGGTDEEAARSEPSTPSAPRNPALEEWGRSLNELAGLWRVPIVNRRTRFAQPDRAEPSLLRGILDSALAANQGDAPPSAARLYARLVGSVQGRPLDSLYVTALCAPGMNLPGTEMDLARWQSDPQIRLRSLLTALPPLGPPSGSSAPDSAYRPPRRALLPVPDALGAALRGIFAAHDANELRGQATQVIAQARRSPRVRFLRQLAAVGALEEIAARYVPGDQVRWPPEGRSLAETRSIQTFERAFRHILVPLQAAWVAAQATASHPNPLVMVLRVRVRTTGQVEVERVFGNLPPGVAMDLVRHIVEQGVRLPPAAEEGVYDFPVVIEE